jgi:hypothetical protein
VEEATRSAAHSQCSPCHTNRKNSQSLFHRPCSGRRPRTGMYRCRGYLGGLDSATAEAVEVMVSLKPSVARSRHSQSQNRSRNPQNPDRRRRICRCTPPPNTYWCREHLAGRQALVALVVALVVEVTVKVVEVVEEKMLCVDRSRCSRCPNCTEWSRSLDHRHRTRHCSAGLACKLRSTLYQAAAAARAEEGVGLEGSSGDHNRCSPCRAHRC